MLNNQHLNTRNYIILIKVYISPTLLQRHNSFIKEIIISQLVNKNIEGSCRVITHYQKNINILHLI